MKKNVLLVSALLTGASVLLPSCGSSRVAKTEDAKWRNVHGVGVFHIPTVADLDVRPTKAFSEMTVKVEGDDAETQAQNLVVAQLLTKENADVLVEPRFSSEKSGFSKLKVTVSGYPATYKNFRPMTPQDTAVLEVNPSWYPTGRVAGTVTTEAAPAAPKSFFNWGTK